MRGGGVGRWCRDAVDGWTALKEANLEKRTAVRWLKNTRKRAHGCGLAHV